MYYEDSDYKAAKLRGTTPPHGGRNMKRQWKMILCLMMALLMLSSCGTDPDKGEQFAEATQNLGPATQAPTDAPYVPEQDTNTDTTGTSGQGNSIFNMNPSAPNQYDESGYIDQDAINEENYIDTGLDGQSDGGAYVDVSQTYYPYAGSTPIPLMPIDAPTPTPRPKLSFNFGSYTAAIGVSFEAPVGWSVDESVSGLIVLSEPIEQIKEGQQCIIRISATPITETYAENELKNEVLHRLDAISSVDFDDWKPSYTSTRHMMGSNGVYANYTGTLFNGTEVGGRVHYVSSNSTLYGVEIVYPLGYKKDYIDEVFTKIRSSIKAL